MLFFRTISSHGKIRTRKKVPTVRSPVFVRVFMWRFRSQVQGSSASQIQNSDCCEFGLNVLLFCTHSFKHTTVHSSLLEPVGRPVGRSVGRPVGRPAGRTAGRLVGRSVGWPAQKSSNTHIDPPRNPLTMMARTRPTLNEVTSVFSMIRKCSATFCFFRLNYYTCGP